MKNTLVRITLAALAVVLLGSCEKINQRIDALEGRIDGIENEKIATISSQIASINSSIADLGTIRSNVTSLRSQVDDHSTDIFNLEEADRALNDRILNLEDYLDDVLPTYAEKDWVKATFSTLAQYEATCDTIAKIDARIGRLDERLSKDIKACADSMKRWVNVQFEAYYTAAEMDAALEYMQAEIDSAKVSGKITDERVDSLAKELTTLKTAVDTAKANIRKEYRAAIDTAIKTSEGKLTKALQDEIAKVNADITALTTRVTNLEIYVATLTGRVSALESMIQAVTIVPAYSDGSVKAEDDTLYIDCIISPASAVSGLTKANFTVLVNKVLTKAVDIKTIAITDDKWFSKNPSNGTVSLKVPVKNYIPANADNAITVAVNIKNGISHFTTEFVPVTVAAAEPIGEYVEIGGVKWATKNVGAENETDYGYYFAWGGTEAYVYSYSQWKYVKDGSPFYGGFSQANAPHYDGSAYTKYTSEDSKTVLESGDDAATAFMGAGWRMPTSAEFQALYNACLNGSYDTSTNPSGTSASVDKGIYWCTSYDGVAGCLFCDGTNKLFFPAAGCGNSNSLYNAGSNGYYWSSSLNAGDTDEAYRLNFRNNYVGPQGSDDRCYGFSVRPVKAAAKPLPAGALKGEFSVSATKKVHFSKGNLRYVVNGTKWEFYENQYGFCNTNTYDGHHADTVSLFTWGYDATKSIVPDGTSYVEGHTTDGESFNKDEDWGYVFGGESSVWCTLSKAEWVYLFNSRTNASSLYKYGVTVCDKTNCLIIAPDNWDTSANPLQTSYDETTWATAEEAGLVCLPAAGPRDGDSVINVGVCGIYWSSTASGEDEAYDVFFYSTNVSPDNNDSRDSGYSVRLVTEVK